MPPLICTNRILFVCFFFNFTWHKNSLLLLLVVLAYFKVDIFTVQYYAKMLSHTLFQENSSPDFLKVFQSFSLDIGCLFVFFVFLFGCLFVFTLSASHPCAWPFSEACFSLFVKPLNADLWIIQTYCKQGYLTQQMNQCCVYEWQKTWQRIVFIFYL